MDLPNLLNKLKNTPEEVKKFLAIEIGFDTIKSAIWQSTGAHTEVISVGSVQTWNIENDILTAIDASLADAQQMVDGEPEQVIFGLPESWAASDGISDNKKGILKEICQKLGLKPVGFVVTTEAMTHYLRDIEGGPPSALLVRVSATNIATSLIYLGRLESTQVVERGSLIAEDVEEGIARIPHVGHLPSRIILLSDMEEAESLRQDLLAFDWQKRLAFLHIPKIELLPKDWSIRAVAVAGGGEVVAALGFTNLTTSVKQKEEKLETKRDLEQIQTTADLNNVHEDRPASAFGFTTVILEDDTPAQAEEEQLESLPDPEVSSFEDTSVISDNNTFDEVVDTTESDSLEGIQESDNLMTDIQTETIETADKEPTSPQSLLLGFKNKIKLIPHVSLSFGRIWLVLIGLIGCALLVGGSYYAYQTFPKATITVAVAMKPFEQQLTFKVDPSLTSTSVETVAIPGQKQTIDKSGSKTVPTTGSKTVGDRAKGKITIYNRTTSPKTLPAGTTIKSNSLKFTLDMSVTIASASSKENADFSVTTEPSKIDASVTASDIGDQYNLAKDTQFSVSNFAPDNFLAVSASSFTGGSSRKVNAVSKEDLINLKHDLVADLQNQISSVASTNSSSGMRQLPVGDPTITKEEYSAKQADQADTLSLDLTMTQTIYSYDVNEVTLLAQQAALQALPGDVQMKPDSTKVDITESTINDQGVAVIKATITIQYIPRVNVSLYVKNLVNTPVKAIANKLSSIPNYQSYSLESKWLLFGRLPLSTKSIEMRINPVAQ